MARDFKSEHLPVNQLKRLYKRTVAGHLSALFILFLFSSELIPTEGAPCGLDLFTLPSRSRRSVRRSIPNPSIDPRFKFASDGSPDNILPSRCTTRDLNVAYLGLGNSECYSAKVTEQYGKLESWQQKTLKVKYTTITGASSAFVTQQDYEFSANLLNTSFAPANISFTSTFEFVENQEWYDEMENSDGFDFESLSENIHNLANILDISKDISQREVHSFVVVLKLDISEFVGLCFPDSHMLARRPAFMREEIHDWLGNICFMDYRYFSIAELNPLSNPESTGLYTVHEMGHSLGLLHTFQTAEFRPHRSNCERPRNAPSSCFASAVSYDDGDYIADTAVMVGSGPYGPNDPFFSTDTCLPGSQYPTQCNGRPFAYVKESPFDENLSIKAHDTFKLRNLEDTVQNYMSYVPESCYADFSVEQIGRMRCFVDRYAVPYGSSRMDDTSDFPPVVSRARIIEDPEDTHILLEWLPPVNLLSSQGDSLPAPAELKFRIERLPPLDQGSILVSSSTYMFKDTTIDILRDLTTYSYRVVPIFNDKEGSKTRFLYASVSGTILARASLVLLVLSGAMMLIELI